MTGENLKILIAMQKSGSRDTHAGLFFFLGIDYMSNFS